MKRTNYETQPGKKVAPAKHNPFEAFLDFNNSPTLKATKKIVSETGQLFDRNKLVAALTGCAISALAPNLATAQESFIRPIGSNEPLKTKAIVEQLKNPPVPKTILSTNNQPNKKTESSQTPSAPPSQLTKEQFQILQKITNSYSRQEIQELYQDLMIRKVIAPDGNVNLFFLQNYLGESNYAKYFTPQTAQNAVSKNKAPTINTPIDKLQQPLSFEGLQVASEKLSKSIARENNDIDPSFVWDIGYIIIGFLSTAGLVSMYDKDDEEKTTKEKPISNRHVALRKEYKDIIINGILIYDKKNNQKRIELSDLSEQEVIKFLGHFEKYWKNKVDKGYLDRVLQKLLVAYDLRKEENEKLKKEFEENAERLRDLSLPPTQFEISQSKILFSYKINQALNLNSETSIDFDSKDNEIQKIIENFATMSLTQLNLFIETVFDNTDYRCKNVIEFSEDLFILAQVAISEKKLEIINNLESLQNKIIETNQVPTVQNGLIDLINLDDFTFKTYLEDIIEQLEEIGVDLMLKQKFIKEIIAHYQKVNKTLDKNTINVA